jgi:hypothetical protein
MENSIIVPGTPEKKDEAKSGSRHGPLGLCGECGRAIKGSETIWILGDDEAICDICIEHRTVQAPCETKDIIAEKEKMEDSVPETPEKGKEDNSSNQSRQAYQKRSRFGFALEEEPSSEIVPETPEKEASVLGHGNGPKERCRGCPKHQAERKLERQSYQKRWIFCEKCGSERKSDETLCIPCCELWEKKRLQEARAKGGIEEKISGTPDEDVYITDLYHGAEKLTGVMLEEYTQNFSSDTKGHVAILIKLFKICEDFDLRIHRYNNCYSDDYADFVKRCRRSCKIMMKKFVENPPKKFLEEHQRLFFFTLNKFFH